MTGAFDTAVLERRRRRAQAKLDGRVDKRGCPDCKEKMLSAATPTSKSVPAATPGASDLVLKCELSMGDIAVMTAAVRDLKKTHGDRYRIAVETTCAQLWEHNPYVVSRETLGEAPDLIEAGYNEAIQQSNQMPEHFIRGFHRFLSNKLGLDIPLTEFKPDIHLSDEEKGWMNQVEQEFGHKGLFWLVFAGGKKDFTAKWWPKEHYQAVIDALRNRIQFVQCGGSSDWHPDLDGVLHLVGRTDLRQLIRLVYHADGVLCPVTGAMHLAAGVPTKRAGFRACVVLGGGREPVQWEAYPGHQFLHTVGALSCCAERACWKSRAQKVGDGDEKDAEALCEQPVRTQDGTQVPRCMAMIQPMDVVRAIERYYEGGVLQYG